VIAPTDTNFLLHQKSSDLSPILKALYEYHQDVIFLGIGFANNGAGSTISFPHTQMHADEAYESQGCDWMEAANPYAPERKI